MGSTTDKFKAGWDNFWTAVTTGVKNCFSFCRPKKDVANDAFLLPDDLSQKNQPSLGSEPTIASTTINSTESQNVQPTFNSPTGTEPAIASTTINSTESQTVPSNFNSPLSLGLSHDSELVSQTRRNKKSVRFSLTQPDPTLSLETAAASQPPISVLTTQPRSPKTSTENLAVAKLNTADEQLTNPLSFKTSASEVVSGTVEVSLAASQSSSSALTTQRLSLQTSIQTLTAYELQTVELDDEYDMVNRTDIEPDTTLNMKSRYRF